MLEQSTLEWKLARLAHEEWCARMKNEGWRQGTTFDAEEHLHDALVPFDELSPADRRSVYIGIVASDITELVYQACDYPRGETRELTTADVRTGARVQHTDEPSEFGHIETWQEDPNFPGALNWIRVRWDSGEVIEHAAPEREIRLVDG